MSSPRANRRRADGFTLIELMLAAGIAAMLSLALYSALSTAFRSKKTATLQTSAMRRAAITLDLLETDLQSVTAAGDGTTLNGPFIGYAMGTSGAEADSVSFTCFGRDVAVATNGVEDPLAEGTRRVELSMQSGGATGSILLRRVQRNLLAPSAITTDDEVLADGLRAFSVRYYDGTEWLDEWDSTLREDASIPVAIMITIELDERGPRAPADDPTRGYRASRIIPLGPTKITPTPNLGGF